VEVLHLRFDPAKVSYDSLIAHFLTFHDPTTLDRQGNDRGTQYASAVFYHTPEQKAVAVERLGKLQALMDSGKGPAFAGGKVVTKLLQATTYYPAEQYHQRYLDLNPGGYCNHGVRFAWPAGSCEL